MGIMKHVLLAILALLTGSTSDAVTLGPRLAAAQGKITEYEARVFGSKLRRICRRESTPCDHAIGIHDGDRSYASLMYSKALARGRLDSGCLWHNDIYPEGVNAFGVRGNLGLSAAYTLGFLGCVPPQVLDIPAVSGYAATLRAKSWCSRHGFSNLARCPGLLTRSLVTVSHGPCALDCRGPHGLLRMASICDNEP
jgi:hypothetical protein